MKNFIKKAAFLFLLSSSLISSAQCLQIESILVDACNTGVNEYDNEMVRFKTGSTTIPINQLSIKSAPASGVFVNNAWPTTTQAWHGLVQNAITANAVTGLNATVVGCGFIMEPPAGIIPANSLVILVSSPNVSITTNSFANLNDTIYMIFQGPGASSGQFGNCCGAGTRSFILIDNLSGCQDTVAYQPALIIGGNGGAVDYDVAGNPTYVNRGCQGAFVPLSVDAGTNQTVCFNDSVTLSAAVSGTYSTVQWSLANAANGNFDQADSLITDFIPAPGAVSPVKAYITIATNCGTFTKDSVLITVTPSPAPVVSSSNGATICSGSSTVLSVVQQSGETYVWNPGNNSGTSCTVSPASTTPYTVTATNSCASTNAVFNVTVNALPTATAGASPITICAGDPTILTAGGTITTYTWNPGGQNTSSITVNPAVGTQTYTLTGSDGVCTNTTTVNVTVNALPATPLPTASPVCEGATITLNANATGVTYTWTGPNSFSSPNQNPAIPSATSSEAGTYTLTVFDGNCNSVPGNVVVTVNPVPILSAVSNQTVCSGSPVAAVNFSATGGASVNWTNSNPLIGITASGSGNIATFIPAVTSVQTGNITATPVFTSTGCQGAATSFSITVNPLPLIDTTNKVIVTANCGASDGSVTGISASGAPALQYSWDNGTTFTASSALNAIPAGTYNLIIEDGNGCRSNASFTVSNLSGPSAPATQNIPPAVCQGATVTPSVISPQGGYTYTWTSTPGGALGTGTSVTINNIGPAGSYVVSVTATDNSGCLGPASTTTITVNANPVPSITASSNSFCQGDTVQLSISPTGAGYSYQWVNGVTPIPGATNPVYTATAAGTYAIGVVDNNGCSGISTTPVILTMNSRPTVTTGNISNNAAACGASDGNASGLSVANGTPGFTYNWYGSTGLLSSSSTTDSLKNVSAGTYTVIVSDANGCKDTATVTVNSIAAAPAPTASSAAYCQGQPINALTATGSGGTLNWYSDAALTTLVGSGTSYTPSPLPTTTTTYYVAESSGLCTGPATPVTITINPVPAAPLASPAAYCQGQTVNALTSSSPGNTITWYSNATLTTQVGTGNSYTPVPSPTLTTTYYLTASSGAGCTSPASNVVITINPRPAISGLAVVDTARCGLNDGSVSGLSASGGTPNYTYQWTNTSTGAVVGTTPGLMFVGAGTYSLTVTDANLCSAGSASTYTIVGTPAVIAAFTQDVSQGVAPVTVNFTNTSVGANTYFWNFGSGVGVSTQQNPTATYTTAGTYMVTFIAEKNGCSDTIYGTVNVEENVDIIIPNIFSPNGDNLNDNFFITTKGIKTLNCVIYNRWGTKVSTISSIDQKWNGKMDNGNTASEGTYFYMIDATGFDSKEYKKQGTLLLVQ